MPIITVFIERPVKVEVEAKDFDEAVELIKQQYNIADISPIKFSSPIEIEEAGPQEAIKESN